jgi:uncharacterized protein (TIGR03437 family)
VRIATGSCGSTKRVAVDMPLEPATLQIEGVRDGSLWTSNSIDLRQGKALALWVKGLPEQADRNNLHVWVNGKPAEIVFLAEPGGASRQVNVQVPESLSAGAATVEIGLGDQPRLAIPIEVLA